MRFLLGGVWLLALAPAVGLAQYGLPGGTYGGPTRFDPNARQVPGPGSRPVVSPYVNLLRSSDPTLNYYGLVQPQVEFRGNDYRLRNDFNSLDSQFLRAQQQNRRGTPSQLGISGHSSQFLTDLQGRPEGIAQEMRDRKQRQYEQVDKNGRYQPKSGHVAQFGNQAYFYRQRPTAP